MTGLHPLSRADAIRIFLAFAFAYFLSALLRAVTATLAPTLGVEFGLQAADLGLLAGAYFLGFAAMQLPLGLALDRRGPKAVLLVLLLVGVIGCAAFASSTRLVSLICARALIGVGVSACLMAPLTLYRARFGAAAQLRANSWMLMTGSLGMVASTLPVQWLLPVLGWRGLFWVMAGLLLGATAMIAWLVPGVAPRRSSESPSADVRYRTIVAHPTFVRSAPLAFFLYGGMIAIQALWAGPWLTRVAGWTATQAAGGLFGINLCMLLAFLTWGLMMPRWTARGISVRQLIARGVPVPLIWLMVIVLWPQPLGAWAWAMWCVSCTVVSLSQPAIGQAFPSAQAGRALSAFNLVIFSGVFVLQWGIGLLIDALISRGVPLDLAFRSALGCFGIACLLSWIWYCWPPLRWREQAGQ